jgi:hypothetical protein
MAQGGFDARRTQNPFYVLGLAVTAARSDVERAGQKLLGLLELATSAQRYESPYGSHSRDAALVRWAVNELRDPDRRVLHELWAELGPANAVRSVPPRLPALSLLRWGGER